MTADRERLSQVLPRYEIRDEIGRGGWGVVYEGWHRELQRSVAIKQLPHHLGTDPSVRDRFISEAQLVASLEHPHIVPVYDFAERDGLYVIVMELASGGTVWQRFTKDGMRSDQAVGTVLAAAAGLHHAHTRGLLHRDVKPDNLLHSASGTVKVADFGIAKSMGDTQAGRQATEGVIGTPAYMAPEQVVGGQLSAATDVYSLGVVLYELLAGSLPFPTAPDAMAQLFQRVHEEPRPLAEAVPGISPPLAAVVDEALRRDPANRPSTAEQFAVELATAATQTFGVGWLERSGVTVMGSTAVIGATERTTGAPTNGNRAAGTVVVRPEDTARLRLGGIQPSGERSVAGAASLQSIDTAPTTAKAPSTMRRWYLGAGGALAAAIVAVVLLATSGGDPTLVPAETPETAAITAAERASFIERCESIGVTPRRCRCAVDRAIEQLDADTFRAGLTRMLEASGSLVPDFKDRFDACVADGF